MMHLRLFWSYNTRNLKGTVGVWKPWILVVEMLKFYFKWYLHACVSPKKVYVKLSKRATWDPRLGTEPRICLQNGGSKSVHHLWEPCFNLSHTIHVWYIHLHLADLYGKCRQLDYYHTWMLWVMDMHLSLWRVCTTHPFLEHSCSWFRTLTTQHPVFIYINVNVVLWVFRLFISKCTSSTARGSYFHTHVCTIRFSLQLIQILGTNSNDAWK